MIDMYTKMWSGGFFPEIDCCSTCAGLGEGIDAARLSMACLAASLVFVRSAMFQWQLKIVEGYFSIPLEELMEGRQILDPLEL